MIPLRVVKERHGLGRIVGLDAVVHRLRSTVVTPIRAAALGDPAVTAPRGVVVYGPAGCGTSHIVSALSEGSISTRSMSRSAGSARNRSTPRRRWSFRTPWSTATATCWRSGSIGRIRSPCSAWSSPIVRGIWRRTCWRPVGSTGWSSSLPPDFEARRIYVDRAIERVGIADNEDRDEIIAALEGGTGHDIDAVFDAASSLRSTPPDLNAIRAATVAHRTDARRWLEEARSLVAMTATRGLVDDLVAHLRRHRLI